MMLLEHQFNSLTQACKRGKEEGWGTTAICSAAKDSSTYSVVCAGGLSQ